MSNNGTETEDHSFEPLLVCFQAELALIIEIGNTAREVLEETDPGWWSMITCPECRQRLQCPTCDSVPNDAYSWNGFDIEIVHSYHCPWWRRLCARAHKNNFVRDSAGITHYVLGPPL
jgi:hypothetical protein